MRDLRELDEWRKPHPLGLGMGDHGNGYFEVPSPQHWANPGETPGVLRCIASNGGGWDHVSVSREDRTPTYEEMDHIARLFFEDRETCMQLHVPRAEHINNMPHCLHLWRPRRGKPIPRPRASYV